MAHSFGNVRNKFIIEIEHQGVRDRKIQLGVMERSLNVNFAFVLTPEWVRRPQNGPFLGTTSGCCSQSHLTCNISDFCSDTLLLLLLLIEDIFRLLSANTGNIR